MNLALIDPFQLAQDSPEALTHDLREYSSAQRQKLSLFGPLPFYYSYSFSQNAD